MSTKSRESILAPIIFVRMHPDVRRDLALLRQLDHVDAAPW
jgi:hypothetical protein